MKKRLIILVMVSLLSTTSVMASGNNSKLSTYINKISKIPTDLTDAREIAVSIAVESVAIPTAVSIASTVGTTASTGTAIATLSGAAATSATLAAVGSTTLGTAIGGATAMVGVVASPAIIGGVIVVGVAAGVAYGINSLIDIF